MNSYKCLDRYSFFPRKSENGAIVPMMVVLGGGRGGYTGTAPRMKMRICIPVCG